MRVAIYVRVSTSQQVQTQTIEQRIQRLCAHIAAQGWQLPDENLFRDDGYSGAALKRPGLDRLRDRAALAQFDKILITDPDRLARNYVHQVLLLEEFQQHGCQVEFLDRPMSQDPHDQLLLQIRGAVAEAAVVGEIFAWYIEESHSLASLAQHLHEQGILSPTGKPRWGLATLRGVLTNPTYTGQLYAFRTTYRPPRIRRSATHPIGRPHGSATPLPPEEWIRVTTVPAVVTEEQFQLAAAKLATNQSFAKRNNTVQPYLLRRLVSCGDCALSCMARRLVHGNYTYYICSGKLRPVLRGQEGHCASRFIPAGSLDELVWSDLCELLTHPEVIIQALHRAQQGHWLPQELQARRENVRRGQVSLRQQLDRLTEAYLSGVMPLAEYQRRRAELEERLTGLSRQEEQLKAQAARVQETAGLATSVAGFCERSKAGLAAATFGQKRQLVELLIDRVIVTGDEVVIRYVIPTSQPSEHIRFCHLRLDYFGDPETVHSLYYQSSGQIRVAAEAVPTVRGAHEGPLPLTQQVFGPHDLQHPLVVDAPALPLQLGGHPTVTVAGERQAERLDPFAQPDGGLGGDGRVCRPAGLVEATATDPREGTDAGERQFRRCKRTHGLPLAEREPALRKAFFRKSFSRVNWPTSRSRSAIRASAAARVSGVAANSVGALETKPGPGNAWAPYFSTRARQLRTIPGSSSCSRQSWARRRSPVCSWRTISNLNSALCWRHMVPLLPSSSASGRGTPCPHLGVHSTAKCTHVLVQVNLGHYDEEGHQVGEETFPQVDGNIAAAKLFHPRAEQLINLINTCIEQAWEKLGVRAQAGPQIPEPGGDPQEGTGV